MGTRDFNLPEDFSNFVVLDDLNDPVRFFTPWRGTFSIFKHPSNKIVCDFDFGWAGGEDDLVKLFSTDTSTDQVILCFPLKTDDKRAIRAGTIEIFESSLISRMKIIRDLQGRIIFGIPEFERTKYTGDIYIKIDNDIGIPNIQVATFTVTQEEKQEDFLVFSYRGKTMEKALYFLVISVESLKKPYEGIKFFFPPELEE